MRKNMEYSIQFLSDAISDIEDAIDYYESQQKGLGKRFTISLNETISYLLKSPDAFPFHAREIRKIPFKKFPYLLFYEVLNKEITVVAIFNTHQNPSKKP
ncbi:MAG: hypothetical protein CMH14_15345 [Mesonia sp.]|nr:hypothetical protein [Mesonia sp.]